MPRDDRRYPKRPFLGVGALIIRRNRILLVQRGKQPLKGWWSLPGGILETGELLADGVRREVREETNLDVKPVEVIEIFERIMPDAEGRAEYHYVLVDYICRVKSGTAQAGSDAAAVAWATEDELENYTLTQGTLKVIRKAFSHLRKSK